jgi:hypothetical protein
MLRHPKPHNPKGDMRCIAKRQESWMHNAFTRARLS